MNVSKLTASCLDKHEFPSKARRTSNMPQKLLVYKLFVWSRPAPAPGGRDQGVQGSEGDAGAAYVLDIIKLY